MVPNEYVESVYFTVLNGKGELVSIASVRKKQQMVEWHVEIGKIRVVSKMKVVVSNSIETPDQPKIVFAENTIRFKQQAA